MFTPSVSQSGGGAESRNSVPNPIAHKPADADSGFGERFETSRDIHPVSEDVVLLNENVAQVDPDAKPDRFTVGITMKLRVQLVLYLTLHP
jgi:hypothetical protein